MSKSKKYRMNLEKTLLDAPTKRKRTVRGNKFYLAPLPEPLKPTPYVPPKVVPKPRVKSRAPVALPNESQRKSPKTN